MTLVTGPTLTDRQRQAFATAVLTPRERGILAHIGRTGETAAATASRLGITERTVNSHLEHAFRKLGVSGQTEAFVALGWLSVPPPVSVEVPSPAEASEGLIRAQETAPGIGRK